MNFKKDKYQIIRNAVSKEVCDIAYRYLQYPQKQIIGCYKTMLLMKEIF